MKHDRLTKVAVYICCAVWGLAPAVRGNAGESTHSLPGVGTQLVVTARAGKVAGKVVVTVGNPQGPQLIVTAADAPTMNHHAMLTQVPTNVTLTDGALHVSLQGVSNALSFAYYVRPDIHLYVRQDFTNALQNWTNHPAASQHVFHIVVRRLDRALEFWLDGRFVASVDCPQDARNLLIAATAGAELLSAKESESPENAELLPLDLAGYAYRGERTLRDLRLDGKTSELKQKKLDLAAPDAQVDIGLSRWLMQNQEPSSFYDPFYARSAWDGAPESIVFRVPKRFYHTAWILCAVAPRESPWMGVRVCRYRQTWDGSGMAVGDTNVRLDPGDPQGLTTIKKVGSVSIRKNGQDITAPVYLAAVPLATGELADYLQWNDLDAGMGDWGDRLDWLNLEFSRKLETRLQDNYGSYDIKPLGPRSGAHILAVTLEQSPVDIYIKSEEPGFSFYKHKDPRLLLETRNPSDKTREIVMVAQVSDVDGKTQEIRRTFQAPPGAATNEWSLGDLDLGWYEADLKFSDTAGRLMWRQSVTFALLPPDTRLAGDESPYGTWWFNNSHYTDGDPERVLPLFQKMGFRHGLPHMADPALYARYRVSPGMMGYYRGLTASNQAAIQAMHAFISNWPTVRSAMIFHEGNRVDGLGLELPYELTGAPPLKLSEKGAADVVKYRRIAEEQVALIRAAKPGIRIILGNGGINTTTLWFREKLPANLWDYCGLEGPLQLYPPESQPNGFNLQTFWIARRMADIYGYTNMPITTCFEHDYRATAPGGLSGKQQAEWYARDVLLLHAWRCPHINVGLLTDVNSSYYTSRWGSTGVCRRSPLHMPKPAYVALATLTLVLDRAEFARVVPTGSTGFYCLEFKKGAGYVYALWAGRGSRPVTMDLAGGKLDAAVDIMGRDMKLSSKAGKLELIASESPCYIELSKPVAGLILGAPAHPEVKLKQAVVVNAMSDTNAWRIAEKADPAFEKYCPYLPMTRGDVALEAGQDNTLKVTLRAQPNVADIVGRYAILEPVKGPLPIAGKPNAIGVWVNGNAGWGRIYFEFEDANGKRWLSCRIEDKLWDLSDWEGETSISHEGWRFVYLPLPSLYPSGYYRPSFRHWQCDGAAVKNFEPAYPIKFTRLYIMLREKLVHATEMTLPAGPSIEIKNLTAGTL